MFRKNEKGKIVQGGGDYLFKPASLCYGYVSLQNSRPGHRRRPLHNHNPRTLSAWRPPSGSNQSTAPTPTSRLTPPTSNTPSPSPNSNLTTSPSPPTPASSSAGSPASPPPASPSPSPPSSSLGLAGYLPQYLLLTNRIHTLAYPAVFALTVLAGNSVCWINTVSYVLAINNFPLDRKIAVGLSTSYVGLSTAIYTNAVNILAGRAGSPARRAEYFLLLNALVPLTVCVLVAPIVLARDPTLGKSRVLESGFRSLFVITVFTGLLGVTSSLFSSTVLLALVVVFFVFLLMPLSTPLVEWARETMQKKCLLRLYDEGEGEEIGPLMMLRRVEFWLYFFVYLFGATLGLVYLNNLGQVAESRGCSGTLSLVSLSSALRFFGRLLPSLFDYFSSSSSKKKRAASTVTAMGAMTAPMCGAFFLLVIICDDVALYASTAVIGLCTGAITSVAVTMTTELFGAANFGVNHIIVVLNIPIGSFGFGYLAALLYSRERAGGEDNCMGHKCYQGTFVIWGCLCLLATVLALILRSITKRAATLRRF
ncbi:major facilitator superfamily protein [Striga asiatica]|uniref:Major facilitator superfamily protein n=1 Tax=Striga asiatica TaxID=4170 RepID=A0A5A7P5P9_STRAF|nr:major facilitator superfamily protein [Striga asiatica]